MTDLNKPTLAQAREGLRNREFSATELTRAFLDAIEAGNAAPNTYVLPTPEPALAQAANSDKPPQSGDAPAPRGQPPATQEPARTRGPRPPRPCHRTPPPSPSSG